MFVRICEMLGDEVQWPANLVHRPTVEQLLDDGRVDGIPAIPAKAFEEEAIRRAMDRFRSQRRIFTPDAITVAAKSPNAKPVIDLDSGQVFPAVSAAAIEMGCDPGPICRAIKQGRPYRGRRLAYMTRMRTVA